MLLEGGVRGNVGEEFGKNQWTGVKGILEWVVLGLQVDCRVIWGGFSGGMAVKW